MNIITFIRLIAIFVFCRSIGIYLNNIKKKNMYEYKLKVWFVIF